MLRPSFGRAVILCSLQHFIGPWLTNNWFRLNQYLCLVSTCVSSVLVSRLKLETGPWFTNTWYRLTWSLIWRVSCSCFSLALNEDSNIKSWAKKKLIFLKIKKFNFYRWRKKNLKLFLKIKKSNSNDMIWFIDFLKEI